MTRLNAMKLTPKTAIVSCSLLLALAMAIAATARSSANEYLIRGRHGNPGPAENEGGATCSVQKSNRQDCAPWAFKDGGVNQDECHAHGCCFDPSQSDVPWCFHPSVPTPNQQQCSLNKANRVDCFPLGGASQDKCQARGCCWVPSSSGDNVAWCFYPHTVSKDEPFFVQILFGFMRTLLLTENLIG